MEAAEAVVPSGFRFLPTDLEILDYLREESLITESMRLGYIRDIDLYAVEPWKLWEWFSRNDDQQDHINIHGIGGGDDDNDDQECFGEDCLYFFTPLKKKTQNGTRVDRTVMVKADADQGSSVLVGTWKFQTAPDDIVDSWTGMPVGVKKAATFVPTKTTIDEDSEDDTISSNSSCSMSKKRKQAPEEIMQGTSYIMNEYTLCPYDNQIYSLCRIRRKIDKKMTTMIKKKMRRSSPSTTNTTTCWKEVVQDQEERAAGYDHHQEVMYNGEISCDDFVLNGEISCDDFVLNGEISCDDFVLNGEISCGDFVQNGEQQQQQPVVVVPEEKMTAATGVSSEIIHHNEENNIWHNDELQQQQENNIWYNDELQQQQEAVVPAQGDIDQISDNYNKGLASAFGDLVTYGFSEEFVSCLSEETAATTGGDDLLY